MKSSVAAILLLVFATALEADVISLLPIATGLDLPVAITHANDSRLFITLQRGQIVIYDGTQILPKPFLDIRSRVLCCGERGLLSVAFHPNYSQNGFFFVYYTDLNGDINIARYKVSADLNVADPNSALILKTIPHRDFANHNGGQLAFGPDGFLYAGTGDGGSGGDPNNNGQNLQALLGKLLRLDVDNGSPYIPPLNPFVGRTDALPEIWAYGLRNPWRFSFDRTLGDLFIGDVGQNSWEEVDFQPSMSAGGENYGWRIMEGFHCYNATTCAQTGLTLPVIEYGHTNGACSITGGYRYRGLRSSRLSGMYIYGDYCNGIIWGATHMPVGSWSPEQLTDAPFNITAFGEDLAGEMYVTDYNGGRILLIEDPLAPTITTVTPSSGRSTGGESVTISGTNLANPSSVTFGGAAGTVTASSSGSITVTTPAAPSLGSVNLIVTTGGGTATSTFRYELGFPTTVVATAATATSVNVSWTTVPGADNYEVSRSADQVTFKTVGGTSGAMILDTTAEANTAYLYRVRASVGMTFGPFSANDLATTVIFTDDPLTAGTTVVKADHVSQLRAAVNAVRVLAGLGAFSFADPTLTRGTTPVRAVHLTELRGRLDEARSALKLAAVSYTDPTVNAGSTLVKAAHFAELRNCVK